MAIPMQQTQQVVTTTQQKMWLLIWHLEVPYKFQMFIWKPVKDILPVAAKFQRMGTTENPNCIDCSNSIETNNHILLHCTVATAVWSGVSTVIIQDVVAYQDIQN